MTSWNLTSYAWPSMWLHCSQWDRYWLVCRKINCDITIKSWVDEISTLFLTKWTTLYAKPQPARFANHKPVYDFIPSCYWQEAVMTATDSHRAIGLSKYWEKSTMSCGRGTSEPYFNSNTNHDSKDSNPLSNNAIQMAPKQAKIHLQPSPPL